MEKIFGHEEESNLTPQDKLRLRLISKQYYRSNLYYRMFFDKHYRPERFDVIVNKQSQFKNKNEFRTYVTDKFNRFPLKSTSFLQKGGYKQDFAQKIEDNDDETRQNPLLEKRLMRSYNRCFLAEIGLYGVLAGTIVYFGIGGYTGHFNIKFANWALILPGLCLSASTYYVRTRHNREFEQQLQEIYKEEHAKYDRFFRDAGYEDYE